MILSSKVSENCLRHEHFGEDMQNKDQITMKVLDSIFRINKQLQGSELKVLYLNKHNNNEDIKCFEIQKHIQEKVLVNFFKYKNINLARL